MNLKCKNGLQFCGNKFVVLVVVLFAIVSLTEIVAVMLYSETSLKDQIHQILQKSSKSIPVKNFRILQLPEKVNSFKLPAETKRDSKTQTTGIRLGGNCKVPPGGFKSWTRGKVTEVTPVIHANCTRLFKGGDEVETARVRLASYTWPAKEHELKFAEWMKEHQCNHFKDELVNNLYTTKEEMEFPLAFTMVIHDNPFQVFRLLKVLYRPHNIYCVHYDSRSSEDMKLLFKKLTNCFDNIIISSIISKVEWGRHSLMDAQMNCFRDLLRNRDKYPWRYIITLCGKELPLRTNNEIVQLLKRLKENSAVHTFPLPYHERSRYESKWTLDKSTSTLVPTNEVTGPIPYNLKIYKSLIFFALTPEFVNYILNDKVAIAFSRFLKDALVPEEMFYSTLFMTPGVPGGYNATVRSLIPDVAACVWITDPAAKREPHKYCSSGNIIHGICIMTSSDLFRVTDNLKVNVNNLKGPMFHNKYFMERDHTVMDCVEEQLVMRNRHYID